MHIAIFVDFHDSTVGGVQTSVRAQRKGLERLGHTVTVVCPAPVEGTTSERDIYVPILPLVRPNGFTLVAPSKRNKRFIESALDSKPPVDIIHIQTNAGIGMMGVDIARRRKIPLVQTMHGRDDVFANTYPFPLLATRLIRWLHERHITPAPVPKLQDTASAHNAWVVMVSQAEAADCVVMPSHHFKTKFREHGVTKPIEVISNGIDDDVVATLPHMLRDKASITSPLKVIWCGRLSPEKRPLESIDAISKMPGVTLDLYGNGPMTDEVQDYINKRGLTDRVHLKGRVQQDEIMRAMQSRDMLLYASYGFDNQPMVILEAVAAGIPIVYCDPDLTECMPEGGGVLTEGTSPDSMAKTLADLQDHTDTLYAMHKVMYEHREKIVQSYHSKKMVDLYQKLINVRAL